MPNKSLINSFISWNFSVIKVDFDSSRILLVPSSSLLLRDCTFISTHLLFACQVSSVTMQKAAVISNSLESIELTISRRSQLQQLLSTAIQFFIHLVTLPYYRFFQFNTIKPIYRLAACASNPRQSNKLIYLIAHWRKRKLAELQFISIAVRHPFFKPHSADSF